MKNKPFPMQPIEFDSSGVARFKMNRLVDALLEHGQKTGFGLNELSRGYHDTDGYQEEWQQLAQLIGYSVSAYGGLSYADPEKVEKADQIVLNLSPLEPT